MDVELWIYDCRIRISARIALVLWISYFRSGVLFQVAGGDAGQHVAPLPGVRLPEDPWRDAGAATCCSGKVACQHNLIHNERQIIGPNPNHTERSESTETVVSQFIQHIGWLGGDVEGYATTAFARAGIDWV